MATRTEVQTSGQPADRRMRFWEAVDERLGLSSLVYPVPEHAKSLPYLLGGITFFGFIILIVTGVLPAHGCCKVCCKAVY